MLYEVITKAEFGCAVCAPVRKSDLGCIGADVEDVRAFFHVRQAVLCDEKPPGEVYVHRFLPVIPSYSIHYTKLYDKIMG